jgi:lipopolysaccharide biosynthesis regulator YciM
MMVELIKTNNNLQAQILEMMKNSQTQVSNTTPAAAPVPSSIGVASNGDHNTINANTINSNNNSFNMNVFLNEKCKDAMNMKDFVNSIQLNLTDLENVGTHGYVKGMSNILIDNLQKMDVYKRPVHCSDVKRDTLYVKDDDEWERDGPDHPKMVNAVLAVEHKNVALVSEWAKANPRCMNSNTRENERYMKLSKAATDGEKEGNIAKVIKKVAKKVAIEKEPADVSNE